MEDLRNLAEYARADDPEETTEAEKEEISEDLVHDLLNKHEDVPPISVHAVQTETYLIETARWVLAMDDVYDIETRRKAAQKKVAEHNEPTNPGKANTDEDEADTDEDDTGMTIQAVQNRIQDVFEGRYGRKNAQEHLDEVLEDIEDGYQARMEAR